MTNAVFGLFDYLLSILKMFLLLSVKLKFWKFCLSFLVTVTCHII